MDRLIARTAEFAELGLVLEGFGPGAVIVRAVPSLLGQVDVAGLIRDLADELAELRRQFRPQRTTRRRLRHHGLS